MHEKFMMKFLFNFVGLLIEHIYWYEFRFVWHGRFWLKALSPLAIDFTDMSKCIKIPVTLYNTTSHLLLDFQSMRSILSKMFILEILLLHTHSTRIAVNIFFDCPFSTNTTFITMIDLPVRPQTAYITKVLSKLNTTHSTRITDFLLRFTMNTPYSLRSFSIHLVIFRFVVAESTGVPFSTAHSFDFTLPTVMFTCRSWRF